jgi:FkbM family methyltransferase
MGNPFVRFPGTTWGQAIIRYINWLLTFVKFLMGRTRFCPFTPPNCRTQRVLVRGKDRELSIRSFRIRDFADYATFGQIFIEEIYNVRRLAQFSALRDYLDRRLEEPGRVGLIVDCGANIGLSGYYFATEFPDCLVVGLEPEPGNYRQALANQLEGNVRFINAGVGSVDGYATIDDELGLNNGFTLGYDDKGSVRIVSIDSLFQSSHVDPAVHVPFLVKIDIEGFEDDLFSTNTDWVERFPVLIIELHDWLYPTRATSRNFLRLMSRLDRAFILMGDSVVSIQTDLLS